MRLLVDTSILIDHLRGDERAMTLLVGAVDAGAELWSSTVVRTEVLAGMRAGEERATLDLLDGFSWLDVTVEVADRAGQLARSFLRSHPGVDTADFLVAASAEILDARLVTLNVRHFPMLPVEAPY